MLETVITQTQPPNKVKSTAFRRHSPEIPSGRHYYGYAGVETSNWHWQGGSCSCHRSIQSNQPRHQFQSSCTLGNPKEKETSYFSSTRFLSLISFMWRWQWCDCRRYLRSWVAIVLYLIQIQSALELHPPSPIHLQDINSWLTSDIAKLFSQAEKCASWDPKKGEDLYY